MKGKALLYIVQIIKELNLTLNSSLTKHVETLNTYSFLIKFDYGNSIFYSGDTYETNFNVIPFLDEGNIIYQGTCLNDMEGNVHTSLRVLSELVPEQYRKKYSVFISMMIISLKKLKKKDFKWLI
ncbi:hypothetical protein CLPUN_41700 [Clostridium puniceum]|uniref:Uncharacterized protein n=1 Tax=Clostridium puniceum TaxID=29367 RepID=A0A1S8T8C1_9CLOT|nr:hypothetical protein CLPUN_41700 [Clostridium puniceum]